MQAVIMAAGSSTRTWPLTLTRPKPLLPLANKPILMHTLDKLQGIVSDVILIVGFKKEMIMEILGDTYGSLAIHYVVQEKQNGTGHALLQAKNFLKGSFLVIGGDDLFDQDDFNALAKYPLALLIRKVKNPEEFGSVLLNANRVVKILEKSHDSGTEQVSCGCYHLSTQIFDHLEKIKESERGEIELTDAINALAKEHPLVAVPSNGWMPITYPWNLLDANVKVLSALKKSIDKTAVLEEGVTIKGAVRIGKNTVLKSGTYIEGPVVIGDNCTIGPHAYIRPDTSIGNNCTIRGEVVDSILMNHTTAKHQCYIGHSVLGEKVNIGAGTITADYRHDGSDHTTLVKDKKVNTHRRKLGAFLGDGVHTAINTSIYPGRKIWPNGGTLPGSVITRDLIEETK